MSTLVAHVGGFPAEEALLSLSGVGAWLALGRSWIMRRRRRRHWRSPTASAPTAPQRDDDRW